MGIYIIKSFRGGISDEEDKGIRGSFKFAKNLDIRKKVDSMSSLQALVDEGLSSFSISASGSVSPSASVSPSHSASATASASASTSPSGSPSASASPSTGISPSPSATPSPSPSPSASTSPSHSTSPSPSPSSGLNTVYDDLVLWFVEASDGYTYEFGNTGSIYRRDSSGGVIRVFKDPDGKIKGACEWYSDDRETFLYWATDTYLKRKDIYGRADWNDWELVGNLVSSDWHTMAQVGGALAIANGRFIAYVGYDESFTPEATDLIPGNLAKTIVERNGRAIIGTERASDSTKSVNGAIDAEVPLAQIGTEGELVFANMNDTIPVTTFPGGGLVNPGGVCNDIEEINFFEWEEGASSWIDKQKVGNLALFGVYNASSGYNGVYSYGRKRKNHPFVLNLDYELDVAEIGAIANISQTLLISYRDNSGNYGVKATDSNNKATGTYEGLDFISPEKRPQNITHWKMAELQFAPLPNGSSIQFWYRVDKNGSFVQAKCDNGQTSFSTANKKKAVFLIGAEGQIFEPRVVIVPYNNYSPEVYKVKVFFN